MGHNSNYSEETGYVNIHGQDVKVFVCEKTGLILVPIDELKELGFRIYRKSQYSRLLIDDSQFNKEFHLYMLESAKSYMLKNEIAFKENDILESINKCKAVLVGSQDNCGININKTQPKTPPSNFVNSYVTETSPTNISITTKLREPLPSTTHSLQSDRMFKGFTQNKSPGSVVNEIKTDSDKQNNFEYKPKTNYDQRRTNESKFTQPETRASFGSNKSFEPTNLSPKTSLNDIVVNDGKTSAIEQGRQTKKYMSNGVDADNKRNFENADEQVERLTTIELNKTEHHVLITHIEKSNCIWVQDIENADVLLDIDSKIKSEIEKQKKQNYNKERTKPAWNKIYLAQHEGEWYRCKVIKYRPLTVSFVDYGNTGEVSDLKEVSEELAKIPCQSARLTFSESHCQYKPQVFDNILVTVRKRFDRGTYSVDIINKEAEPVPTKPSLPPTPTLKTFFRKPQSLCKLENGQRVMIIGHIGGQLALRTKETFEKLRQVEQALTEIDPTTVEKVEKDQLVVCNKDDKLYRAIVLSVNGKSVEIELLDYYEKLKVDCESLKYISESLSKEPLTYIMTPSVKGYSEAADPIIEELISKKSKPIVVLSDGQFDLKIGEELLSDKLKPTTKHSNRPLLKDFKFFKPSSGAGEYILNVYRNVNELYFTSGEALEEHLDSILKNDLEDDTPHKPVMGEVCFGFYQDSWSRCVVLRNSDTTFEVQFIDFGNLEVLKSDQLRKLTDDAKNTPVLVMKCKLIGLPPGKNIEELVKETMSENDSYEIIFKKFDGEVYEIEVPSVYTEISS